MRAAPPPPRRLATSPKTPGARLEIQTALQALLEILEELRPHPSVPPAWDPDPNLGGYASYRCLCG
ncbi:MAG TPA: hypothetical protein VF142_16825 [Longimicrobium sp.]